MDDLERLNNGLDSMGHGSNRIYIEMQISSICKLLSNRVALELISCIMGGLSLSSALLQARGISRWQYYRAITRLADLGLIFRDGGSYRLTPLGFMIYINNESLIRALNSKKFRILNQSYGHVLSEQDKDYESKVSRVIWKEMENSIGISGIGGLSVFNNWDRLVDELKGGIDAAASSIFGATQYMDYRLVDSLNRAANRGVTIRFISNTTSKKKNIRIMTDMLKELKNAGLIMEMLNHVNIRGGRVLYSYVVIDGMHVGVELIHPHLKGKFFIGFKLESALFAETLASIFEKQWEASSEAGLIKALKMVERLIGH